MNKVKLVLILALISTLAQGQFFHNVGIKYGVSIASQDWRIKRWGSDIEKDYRTGLYAGISSEILRKNFFSIGLDLSYIQKGSQDEWELTDEFNPEGTGETETLVNRYDFLTFSPTVKFRLPRKNLAPYIFAGPRLDYLTGGESEDFFVRPESTKNSFILGASYGLGMVYKFEKLIFSIEVQHQPDLTPFIHSSATSNTSSFTVINQAYAATLGIKYIL